ncbi:MAG: hypothetical protein IJ714_01070 [Bacteroidales bacterium]|nr:hypothetical protein [Bacteroidales bacterium]
MRRKMYDRLLQWKQEKNGTTALMIEGARRVGKSYNVTDMPHRATESGIIQSI